MALVPWSKHQTAAVRDWGWKPVAWARTMRPAFRFLCEDDGHSNTAGIWFFEPFGGFPSEGGHYGFTADELNIFDFPDRLSPARRGEDEFCGFMDGGGTNPKLALQDLQTGRPRANILANSEA